ncbi:MAG: HTH-type transcriptional repressor PurR [Candidatus Omnitrophica bacterium ADurb.Bin292]|jgi:DNA-binding LacI/PurR family transcriptional regulator|nr:MAG: HTH-type transcriptional repressor PurR [Candidatus Omnitrophica bacterium ADurb.Bin292]
MRPRGPLPRRYTFGILTTVAKDIFRSSYHAELLSGVFKRAFEKYCDLKIIPYRALLHTGISNILHRHSLDGLMIMTWRWIHPRFCQLIENTRDTRVLVVNDPLPGLGVNIVQTDVAAGMRLAVNFLFQKNMRRIGMLHGPRHVTFRVRRKKVQIPFIDTQLKLNGFTKASGKRGIKVRKEWIRMTRANSESEGYRVMKKWLCDKDLPRAILCGNDDLAFGAIKAVRERGFHCPGDMAVIGFDDNNRAGTHVPPLTTIRQPLMKMGEDAVNILLGKIGRPGSAAISKKYLPQLIIRKSA